MSTKKFAVLGSPIAHSKSPLLHNAAYDYLGIGGIYSQAEVSAGKLSSFLSTRIADFDGFSITMPLKEEAYECADVHDEISARIQVANTLILRDHSWYASNTDVLGFQEIFKRMDSSAFDTPLILGSGSTAKSAVLAMNLLGVSKIHMMARNELAVRTIQHLFPDLEISFQSWGGEVENASLVVIAVPIIQGVTFTTNITQFVDVNYTDSNPDIFELIQADTYSYINGLHLLVYQAAFQVIQMRTIDDDRFEDIVRVMFAALEI